MFNFQINSHVLPEHTIKSSYTSNEYKDKIKVKHLDKFQTIAIKADEEV